VGVEGAGGYSIFNACSLNPTRPRSVADCPMGYSFECAVGRVGATNIIVAVNCQCTMRDCTLLCDNGLKPLQCEGKNKLCPCTAYTGILK
jgi:hypothetical protein